MPFRITGLNPKHFRHLYGLSDQDLASRGVVRMVVDSAPGFPDRIEMRDLEPGETALLLNYTHQPAATPYRASHAIFVREGAETPYDAVDTIPEVMRIRLLSLRAFDSAHMMVEADIVDGNDTRTTIEQWLTRPDIGYIHVHNAKRGCYAARVERA